MASQIKELFRKKPYIHYIGNRKGLHTCSKLFFSWKEKSKVRMPNK
jgi:hypothetical protein